MNLQPLIDAKASILADPNFDMGIWGHCIAGHLCKVGGAANVWDIPCAARRLLGVIDVWSKEWVDLHWLFCTWPSGKSQNKQYAIEVIDKFIADHQPHPQPVLQPEMEEERELVGV